MDAILQKNILATVEIPSLVPIEQVAAKLSGVIDGIVFEKDETGRFDEVPAFIARHSNSGMIFILFGIPEGEFSDAYTFEFSAETDLPIQEFRKNTLEFLSDFLEEKGINSRGYFDYSDELAKSLSAKGIEAYRSAP